MSKPTDALINTLSRRSESAQVLIRFAAWWFLAFPAAVLLYAYDLRTRALDPMDAFKVFAAWGLLWLAYAEHKRANRAEARADALQEKLITIKFDPAPAPEKYTEPWAEVMMGVTPDGGVDLQAEKVKVSRTELEQWMAHNAQYMPVSLAKQMLHDLGDIAGFDKIRGKLLNLTKPAK